MDPIEILEHFDPVWWTDKALQELIDIAQAELEQRNA